MGTSPFCRGKSATKNNFLLGFTMFYHIFAIFAVAFWAQAPWGEVGEVGEVACNQGTALKPPMAGFSPWNICLAKVVYKQIYQGFMECNVS